MEFINATPFAAGWTMGFERDGREFVIAAIKATFTIPRDGREPELAETQIPLIESDQFTGEPGLSATVCEADYAHHKPMCDVLLNASAYAPPGKLVRQIEIGVRVGRMVKQFNVVGDRFWCESVLGIRATEPEPFSRMPISYDNAFGGRDESRGDPASVKTFLANPVGRGYSHFKEKIDGKPLPNTEERERSVVDANGSYRPMSLGPIGRSWQPRIGHAGTYDQEWLDQRAPFWPDNFDYRYFQAAPVDQQIPYPTGGEQVVLSGLTQDEYVTFALPSVSLPVWFLPYKGRDTRVDGLSTRFS